MISSLIVTVVILLNGPTEMARASFYGYGDSFHGRTMANGKVFNRNDPTVVASRDLPFGTRVEFINPETGQAIVCTVQDRGPVDKHRDFDLSYGAARKLGLDLKRGLFQIQARVLD